MGGTQPPFFMENMGAAAWMDRGRKKKCSMVRARRPSGKGKTALSLEKTGKMDQNMGGSFADGGARGCKRPRFGNTIGQREGYKRKTKKYEKNGKISEKQG